MSLSSKAIYHLRVFPRETNKLDNDEGSESVDNTYILLYLKKQNLVINTIWFNILGRLVIGMTVVTHSSHGHRQDHDCGHDRD